MAKQLQKLELNWMGKGNEPQLEPRILIEDPSKSFGDLKSENMLIYGDNLLALKALEQQFSNQIKCICIDPPYNTGSAFEHYEDGIEHSLWLSLINDRLKIIYKLLSNDGTLWIAIDDNEAHYLKVICDEIFGRINFVSNVIWEKKSSPQNDAKWISDSHDHILVYAKNKDKWRPNKLARTNEQNAIYKHSDDFDGIDESGNSYGRGTWFPGDMTVKTVSEKALYPIKTPSGKIVYPAKGRAWVYFEDKFKELIIDKRITFGKSGENKPCIKRFLSEIENNGIVPKSVWHYSDVGENRNARQEVLKFNDKNPFATPKPEKLMERIISIATIENDIVLDSFLGSGTTAAVAHKMKRKWIGIELGEHAITHCLPRLQQVVSGKDKGGITESINWKGGGGFKFYTLAPSLVQKDKYGTEIINPEYNPTMLAAAMAKQEGFRYQPDENNYWKQGMSSEKDFIFTTTQFVTFAMLDKLSEELKPNESLLVCCKSFAKGCNNRHTNITIKKIPQMLLGRCEFGKDDYSFNIVNLPHDEIDFEYDPEEINEETPTKIEKKTKTKKQTDDENQSTLF